MTIVMIFIHDAWQLCDVAAGMQDTESIKQGIEDIRRAVNDMLLSQMGPNVSATTREQEQYRQEAIKYYYGEAGCTSPTLKCMVTGGIFPNKDVVAGHVFRQAWPVIYLVSPSPAFKLQICLGHHQTSLAEH